MLRKCALVVALASCSPASQEPKPTTVINRDATVTLPVYSVKIVSASDSSGVGSVACPTGSRITGGGCRCHGLGDPLFGAAPAGNSYVCGCYLTAASGSHAVDSFANCLSSDTAGTLSTALIGEPTRATNDIEAAELFASFQEAQKHSQH